MEIDLTKLTPDIRHLNDMREVLADKEFAKDSPDMDLYYMYRKVAEKDGLKSSITITLAKKLGKEFNKTQGHVHDGNFAETYTVLEGEAIFLMQKTEDDVVKDVFSIKAKKGQTAVIPAGYGHVTINPSSTDLKTQDWTSLDCKNNYDLYKKLQGSCYYYTINGWVKNENYKNIPELRFEEALESLPEDLTFLKG